MIKKILRNIPKPLLVTLFYVISFINLFLRSNRDGCQVFGEENESEGSAELDHSVDSLRQLAIYYKQMNFPYRCLFTLPIPLIRNGIEEICQFFFQCCWQPQTEQFSEEQINGMYSVFVILVLQYETIFESLLKKDGHLVSSPILSLDESEFSSFSTPDESEQTNKSDEFFRSELPPKTSYSILSNSSSTYYCCMLLHYQEKDEFFVPSIFFLLTTIPMPQQICGVLDPLLRQLSDQSHCDPLLQFLLRDALCPIPNALKVQIRIAGKDLCLHTTETHDRFRNGTFASLFLKCSFECESVVSCLGNGDDRDASSSPPFGREASVCFESNRSPSEGSLRPFAAASLSLAAWVYSCHSILFASGPHRLAVPLPVWDFQHFLCIYSVQHFT